MTEAEWLACVRPQHMMSFLDNHRVVGGVFQFITTAPDGAIYPSDRKKRLFICACCRRIWHLISAKRGKPAVEAAERFADGLADETERVSALQLALEGRRMAPMDSVWSDAMHAVATAVAPPLVHWQAGHRQVGAAESVDRESPIEPTIHAKHAELLRHIVGNPFRSYSAPAHWPANVTDLATSLYDGGDCAFALHDALLEAGHAELAEHFGEREHPKGCWAVDLILGKA